MRSLCHGPLARYVKLRDAHAPGMPGTFSPPPRVSNPDMHHGTCVTHVPICMPGSLTSSFLWNRWRGKRSRHSRRMRNLQIYVSDKMPVVSGETLWSHTTYDCLLQVHLIIYSHSSKLLHKSVVLIIFPNPSRWIHRHIGTTMLKMISWFRKFSINYCAWIKSILEKHLSGNPIHTVYIYWDFFMYSYYIAYAASNNLLDYHMVKVVIVVQCVFYVRLIPFYVFTSIWLWLFFYSIL